MRIQLKYVSALAVWFWAGSGWAAEIRGRVTDASGGVLPGAVIRLQNVATGAETATETDNAGGYAFSNLGIGIYRVSSEKPGFSQDARTVSLAESSESLEVNFIIAPGGLTASVTVTASRSARDTLVVPVRAEALTEARLLQVNPTSTGDALLLATNVTPVGNGPFQVRPRLRGLDSTRVLVLVDGERLNNARTATDRAGIEVGLVDPFTIQSAEVASGTGSVLYGTDALAGTINLITEQPSFSDQFKVQLGFDGYFSSNETGRRGAITLGASDKRYAIRFTGSLEAFDNYRSGEPAEESSVSLHQSGLLRQNDTIDQLGFNFRAFPDPFNAPFTRRESEILNSGAEGNNINLAGLFSLAENDTLAVKYLRRRASDVGFADFVPPFFFQQISLPRSNLDKVSARYQKRALTPWFSHLSATVYYQKQDRQLRNDFPVQFPVPGPGFFPVSVFGLRILSDTEQNVGTIGLDLQSTFLVSPTNVLTAGVTFFRDRSEDERTTVTQTSLLGNVSLGPRGPQPVVFPQPVPLGPPVTANPVRVPDASFSDFALFAQDEWDVHPRVRLVGSLRIDRYSVNTDPTPGYAIEALLVGARPPIDRTSLPDVASDSVARTAFTGDLGVIFRWTDQVSLTARYGRSYRHPNLEELLFSGPATVGNIVPNLQVEPETGNNLDFGIKLRTRRVAGSLTYFNNGYDGFISTEVVSVGAAGPLSQAINFADVRIQGLEGDVGVPFSAAGWVVDLFGNFAYTRGEVLSGTNPLTRESLSGTPQDNITPFKAITGLRATSPAERYWIEYSNRIQTEVKRVAVTLLESPFLIAQDLYSLDGFAVHRLAGGIDWKREGYRVGVSLAVENLGNRFYREHFQFAPARGRSFTVGLHLRTN
jgi:hemoglobin/transferrin/lactoferrin receptor protein